MPPISRSARLRAAALVATGALAFALAGCAAPSGGGSEPGELPGTTTAIAEPPVTAAEQDPADPRSWAVTGEGVGSIRIGAGFDETLAVLPGEWSRIADCGAEWTDGDEVSLTIVSDAGEIAGVEVAGTIGAPSHAPRTPEGLGLGSMRDEVREVYPAASERATGDAGGTTLKGDSGVAFELGAGDRVVAMTVATDAAPACERRAVQ